MPISNPIQNELVDLLTLSTKFPICKPGGRLSLSASAAVADVGNVSTIYYHPFEHSLIPLWNNAEQCWVYRSIPDEGIALNRTGDNPRNIDIYANLNDAAPGGIGLDVQTWSNDTMRFIPRAVKNGIPVVTFTGGDHPIKTLLGSARMVGSAGAARFYDTDGRRLVSNETNKVRKRLLLLEGASTWGVTLNSWQPWNGNAANIVETFSCDGEAVAVLQLKQRAAGNPNSYLGSGITVNNLVSPEVYAFGLAGDVNLNTPFVRPVPAGYTFFAPLNMSTGGTLITTYGGVDTILFGTWDC